MAILIWGILIFIITCYSVPGFLTFILIAGLVIFVAILIFYAIKTHYDMKDFDRELEEAEEEMKKKNRKDWD